MVANRLLLFVRLRIADLLCALAWTVLVVGNCSSSAQEMMFAEEAEAAFDDLFDESPDGDCDVCDPNAAQFDSWESVVEESPSDMYDPKRELLPFDWIRHFGFKHSSSHGRNVGKGVPLKGSSWLNRPYHVDWFLGPLLGDDLINDRVSQSNVLFGGLRLGWDVDYYWGLQWRFGWADPKADFDTPQEEPNEVSYFVSDVDLVYYPWGDSRVRPFLLWGIGVTQIDFRDDEEINQHSTLATMPFGGGVQFHQTPWLVWRLEVLDNLAFGDERLSTMHNVSITAGMDFRFGARPASYWPWRSSRKIW